jgi:hypothetical protein
MIIIPVAEVTPAERAAARNKVPKLIAQFGPETDTNAWEKAWLENHDKMPKAGLAWTDISNLAASTFKRMDENPHMSVGDVCRLIEQSYSAAELQEAIHAARAEGFAEGLKNRSGSNGKSNGGRGNGPGFWLPDANTMIGYCRQRLNQLAGKERVFIDNIYPGMYLSPGRLGFLTSIFVKHNGNYKEV